MSSETPMTEAGRALAEAELHDYDDRPIDITERIAAIETEAWNAALTAVEEAVGEMDEDDWDDATTVIRAGLAALRKGSLTS